MVNLKNSIGINRNYNLNSNDDLTVLVRNRGILTWIELIQYVKNLPYGRNKNRTDFGLVISENKGTCSSKHALLKIIADLNNIPNINLVLGIYKMNQINTPKIGNELINNSIEYIPEAHCYLKINNKRTDYTTKESDFYNLEKDIIQEKEIEPVQVAEFKVEYHKIFLKNWIEENNIPFDFNQIWKIREKCIANLTEENN